MSIRPTHRPILGLVIAAMALSLGGCIYEVGWLPADGDDQFMRFVPIQGMHQQTHYRDQFAQPTFRDDQAEGMRYPPPKTVPVDGYHRDDQPDVAQSAAMANPVPMTQENLKYGQYLYDEQCAVCHGMEGHGDGTIVEAGHYGAPPTLNSDRLRGLSDGEIYHIITYGQGLMWPYDNNLTEMERWAVVNYVRALQRADFPEPIDLDRMRYER